MTEQTNELVAEPLEDMIGKLVHDLGSIVEQLAGCSETTAGAPLVRENLPDLAMASARLVRLLKEAR